MKRIYLQLIAVLMGTAAITFVAAEWRWEPASAGHYLVIVSPGSPSLATGTSSKPGRPGADPQALLRLDLR